ncbi:hypothetical protein Csa_002087 [Cucumis sativus]|uniref:Uncharacterized protein n=1 Tax=Cucumis sativus TaxID=3659 RepID=A0A0A0LHG6_CUCSA|nr:hypothetical protein Csa_002087 [Cucumis sativus]
MLLLPFSSRNLFISSNTPFFHFNLLNLCFSISGISLFYWIVYFDSLSPSDFSVSTFLRIQVSCWVFPVDRFWIDFLAFGIGN